MKKKNVLAEICCCFLFIVVFVPVAAAQKKRPVVKPKIKPQEIIFAVINDGQTLEPIAIIDKGALDATRVTDGEPKALADFTKTFYKPNTVYRLIFGAADAGTVTVKSFDTKAECSKNMAQVTTQSGKAKLKGLVMGLATNAPVDKTASGLRRLPTAGERAEIESLVRAEFTKQSVAAGALKNLRYHNLTALDVDNDKRAEMVGSFWVETSPTSRALLFFIADKDKDGKYSFGYSDFRAVKQEDVMSSDIKDVDTGIYNELLLDALEYNGDTTAEVFTYVQSFEGSGFNVYSRVDGKWTKEFEGSNYHCGY